MAPAPYSYFCVFSKDQHADRALVLSEVAKLLGPADPDWEPWDHPRVPTSWWIHSGGRVPSHSVADHVQWLLDRVASQREELAQLIASGHWATMRFHYFVENEPPDPAEVAQVDAALEAVGITFDLELERDDVPPWSRDSRL